MNFPDILRFYRRGAAERKVQQELDALLLAIEATKKGGEITVTLKIKPSKAGENETDIDVKAKLPKVPLPTATFFLEGGKLSRTNPRQMDAFGDDEDRPGVASLDAKRGLTGEALAAHMAAG